MIFVKNSPLKISPFIIALWFNVFRLSSGNVICDSAYSVPKPGSDIVFCETFKSPTPHYCKASSCHPPQFKQCYEPLKLGPKYWIKFWKPVRAQEMHSFQLKLYQSGVFAYAGSLPDKNHPSSDPQAICFLGPTAASCGSCSRVPP
ncbi:hypothetical protein O181_003624 [Austropuccinia psidii MF-1]|uniref:Secreted protein n=1 Tax=Austropuccinia psidii MF-1 TaxID=1389203 RepID=A0A9Q3BEP8_9BASI|nr:hypothetical protein [Austropuccinia psidii MF-1]